MHFKDLSPYTYTPNVAPDDRLPLRNVGWLERGHRFPRGEVPADLVDCLLAMATHPVNTMRGFQACDFCRTGQPAREQWSGGEVVLGNAEIHVPGRDGTYVAPTLLPHYIRRHGYRPPGEFLEALRTACSEPKPQVTDINDARARADRLLEQMSAQLGVELAVDDHSVREEPWAWVFGINSKAFLETGSPKDALPRIAPIVVEKDGGVVHRLSTAQPVEDQLEYLRRGRL